MLAPIQHPLFQFIQENYNIVAVEVSPETQYFFLGECHIDDGERRINGKFLDLIVNPKEDVVLVEGEVFSKSPEAKFHAQTNYCTKKEIKVRSWDMSCSEQLKRAGCSQEEIKACLMFNRVREEAVRNGTDSDDEIELSDEVLSCVRSANHRLLDLAASSSSFFSDRTAMLLQTLEEVTQPVKGCFGRKSSFKGRIVTVGGSKHWSLPHRLSKEDQDKVGPGLQTFHNYLKGKKFVILDPKSEHSLFS